MTQPSVVHLIQPSVKSYVPKLYFTRLRVTQWSYLKLYHQVDILILVSYIFCSQYDTNKCLRNIHTYTFCKKTCRSSFSHSKHILRKIRLKRNTQVVLLLGTAKSFYYKYYKFKKWQKIFTHNLSNGIHGICNYVQSRVNQIGRWTKGLL